MLARSYSMVGYYSPFIGGVALALGLVPGVRFPELVLTGVVLAGVGFLVIALVGRLEEGEEISGFEGLSVSPGEPLASTRARVFGGYRALEMAVAVGAAAGRDARADALRGRPLGAGRRTWRDAKRWRGSP